MVLAISLEKGAKAKVECPYCHKPKVFRRYLVNGNLVHDTVGICDRKDNCGVSLTPSQYALSIGRRLSDIAGEPIKPLIPKEREPLAVVLPPSIIDKKIVTATSIDVRGCCNLRNYFYSIVIGDENIWKEYQIGVGKEYETIFWQIDVDGNARSGKIIQYKDGKRIKGEGVQAARWVHNEMKLKDFNLEQVFFGINRVKPKDVVVIVESEKTAILLSCMMSQKDELAYEICKAMTGGHHDLSTVKIVSSGFSGGVASELHHKAITKNKDLIGHEVYLCPDISQEANWDAAADLMAKYFSIQAEMIPISPENIQKYDLKKGDDLFDMFWKVWNEKISNRQKEKELCKSS